jgi:hypothetical protein
VCAAATRLEISSLSRIKSLCSDPRDAARLHEIPPAPEIREILQHHLAVCGDAAGYAVTVKRL